MLRSFLIILGCIGILFLSRCKIGSTDGVRYSVGQKPHALLSDYGFFKGKLSDIHPTEGVLPYDLNSPLFSDYAHKSRFVWIPQGKKIRYNKEETFEFPPGSILIKHFYYQDDERIMDSPRRIIETRLLIQQEDKMEAHSYIWNKAQTEASLEILGDVIPVSWTDKDGIAMNIDYVVPNKNQCKGCHYHDGEIRPIGPKARNLNKPYPYPEGPKNQLVRWKEAGILEGYTAEEEQPQVAVWNEPESGSLHDRAMAYLDINCGHCHNPHGPANTSGLNLTANQALNMKLGIMKKPVASGKGSGGRPFSIVPGHPEQSILLYRMESLDPGAMMPELGRRTVHKEGVELIEKWIASLE